MNKIKVSFKTRYIVNDNAVIAIVQPNLTNKDFHYLTFCLKREYRGVTTLKAGDTNNVVMAKSIARKKAIRSVYKDIRNKINDIQVPLSRELSKYRDYLSSVTSRINDIDNEIVETVSYVGE